jgi:hypothetical protein
MRKKKTALVDVLDDGDPFAESVDIAPGIKSDLPEPASAPAPESSAIDDFIQEGRPGGPVPGVPEALSGIIEHVFSIDVDAEYKRLLGSLELGPKRHDKGAVRESLDRVERDTICAARIHRVARSHEERFEMEMRERTAALRDEARRHLEAEKKAGTRAKQITEGDIEDFCISNYGDEWRAMQDNRNRVHGTCRVLEELVKAYQSRQATVRLLASE